MRIVDCKLKNCKWICSSSSSGLTEGSLLITAQENCSSGNRLVSLCTFVCVYNSWKLLHHYNVRWEMNNPVSASLLQTSFIHSMLTIAGVITSWRCRPALQQWTWMLWTWVSFMSMELQTSAQLRRPYQFPASLYRLRYISFLHQLSRRNYKYMNIWGVGVQILITCSGLRRRQLCFIELSVCQSWIRPLTLAPPTKTLWICN